MNLVPPASSPMRRDFQAFAAGGSVAVLGGLIGLGGAEFRLPLLIGLFRFAALEAVVLNKAIGLVVVTALGLSMREHRRLKYAPRADWLLRSAAAANLNA